MLKNNELVSIIVPVYNVEKYIHRAIDSIINQTYKNLEIILVDDGSTDSSKNICDEYKAKDNRVVVIHQKNQGLSAARNVGLEMCKGDYISFVDSDDSIDKQYIEILYRNLKETDSDISIGSVYKINIDGSKIEWLKLRDESSDSKSFIQNLPMVFYSALYKLAKKEIYANIRFPVGKYSEDAFVIIETLCNAKRICSTSKFIYNYFNNPESISHLTSPKKYVDFFESRDHLIIELFLKNINGGVFYKYLDLYILEYVNSYKGLRKLKMFKEAKQMSKMYKSTVKKISPSLNFKKIIKTRFTFIVHYLSNKFKKS